MNNNEKIALIEEAMDVQAGTVKAEDVLADYEEWDSIAILSFVSLMDATFKKIVTGTVLKNCVTVQDLLDLMN